jgi:hypothetical protein
MRLRLCTSLTNEKLVFPKGAKLRIVVSATVKTNAGTCSLGSSKKEVDPFE